MLEGLRQLGVWIINITGSSPRGKKTSVTITRTTDWVSLLLHTLRQWDGTHSVVSHTSKLTHSTKMAFRSLCVLEDVSYTQQHDWLCACVTDTVNTVSCVTLTHVNKMALRVIHTPARLVVSQSQTNYHSQLCHTNALPLNKMALCSLHGV